MGHIEAFMVYLAPHLCDKTRGSHETEMAPVIPSER